jgi:hypothetical protein
VKRGRQGAFFDYILKPEFATHMMMNRLARCQIYDDITKAPAEFDNCFVCALILQGAPDGMISELRTNIKSREVKDVEISALATQFEVCVQVADVVDGRPTDHRRYGVTSAEATKTYKLARYRNHYFINQPTEFTKYYIENIGKLPESKHDHRKHGDRSYSSKESKYFVNTAELIPMLYNQGYFRDMTYEEYARFPFIKYMLSDDDDLSYTDELGVRKLEYKRLSMITQPSGSPILKHPPTEIST